MCIVQQVSTCRSRDYILLSQMHLLSQTTLTLELVKNSPKNGVSIVIKEPTHVCLLFSIPFRIFLPVEVLIVCCG